MDRKAERYIPNDSFLRIVRPLLGEGWLIVRSDPWFNVTDNRSSLPAQGWKIHVSSIPSNAEDILTISARVCTRRGTTFKFALDPLMLTQMNSKSWTRGGSGKFLTIYPKDHEDFEELIEDLYGLLKDFRGPYVLSDRRYKDCQVLYYRYGGILPRTTLTHTGTSIPTVVAPDGTTIHDVRSPFFNPPAWAPDPFLNTPWGVEGSATETKVRLLNGRYKVESALTFSNSGGVYIASDQISGQRVVLKEARPHTGHDSRGNDSVKVLKKEFRILQQLETFEVAPRPIELFTEWEHSFLAEEFLEGSPLWGFPAQNNPLLGLTITKTDTAKYFGSVRTIWKNLLQLVGTLHQQNIIFGDLSPRNVLMTNPDRMTLKVVDFEGAIELGVDEPTFLYTAGFASPAHRQHGAKTFADDCYSVGALMMHLIFPLTPLFDVDAAAGARFLSTIFRDLGYPLAIQDAILSLMDPKIGGRANLPVAAKAISSTIRLRKPSFGLPPSLDRIRLEKNAIIKHIRASADPADKEVLFMHADSRARSHPMSAGYGASGIARALHMLEGRTSSRISSWLLQQNVLATKYSPGLYVGSAGIAWALGDLGHFEVAMNLMRDARRHVLFGECLDLFHGIAGYGLACLKLWHETQDTRLLEEAVDAGEALVARRVETEESLHWPQPDGSVKLGYARGASGISVFLLYLSIVTQDPHFAEIGRRGLDFDLSHGIEGDEGSISFPRAIGDPIRLPYWYEGTAGIGSALLRYAYTSWDRDLADLVPRLALDANRKYTVWPGLFRGLAGVGNFALDCFQFLRDPRYLEMAKRSASGLLLFHMRTDQGSAFPGDQVLALSTDFGSGSSGIALFLERLLRASAEDPTFCSLMNFNFMLDELLCSEECAPDESAATLEGQLALHASTVVLAR